MAYFRNILIAIDQLANTIANGSPDETISSRCGKVEVNCRFCSILCKLLDKVDSRHCKKSIELDEGDKYVEEIR